MINLDKFIGKYQLQKNEEYLFSILLKELSKSLQNYDNL